MFEEYTDDLQQIQIYPNGKVFRLTFDATVREFRLLCSNYSLLNELRDAFSTPNRAQFFIKQYGFKAEPKLYMINKFGYFATGLLFEVLAWIKDNFGDLSCIAISAACKKYIVDYVTPLKNSLTKDFKVYNIAEDLGRNNELKRQGETAFEFRDYQLNAVEYLIAKGYGRGLIEIPTAGGKSFIIANFIWNIHKNFDTKYRYLILVPNKQLVEQFYKDLLDYGFTREQLTRFTAGLKKKDTYNPDAQIVISNRQYMFLNKDMLKKVDVLIVDEVHTAIAAATQKFINSLNCKIKVGCSGTLPREKYEKWILAGMFGKTVYVENITTLQQQGFISKLKITLLKIKDKAVENDRSLLFHSNSTRKYEVDENGNAIDILFDDAYKAEHEYFEKNYKELYKPVFDYLYNLNSNTLILFTRIEIGKNLFELAKGYYKNKNVYYIDGSIDVSEREQTRQKFEQSDGNLLLAQVATFSTGINIKRLSNLVFLTSSKSFSQVIQSIGRTLRLHFSKTEAHLIDVSWIPFKYSQRHLNDRLQIYKMMYNKKPDEVIQLEI